MKAGLGEAGAPKRIAVLDLVDLADNQAKPEIAEALRSALGSTGSWTVIHRDTVGVRLSEYNMNPSQPCNNPQCSFDVGNVVQTEYVVFGTSSPLSSVQNVTLKLLHIPSARIVWTRTLEASGPTDAVRARALERDFAAVAKELSGRPPEAAPKAAGRSLAVVDLSENSLQSRVFLERVHTRIQGSPSYDPMSPVELAELLAALEINKYSIVPSLDNMIGLGRMLGVSNLLYSRLYRDGRSYIYRLAMYDVAGKSLVLELPPQPSPDLIKLLDYEKVFFNTLFTKENEASRDAKARDGKGKSNKALWISLGVLGVGGGIAAYWVDNLRKDGGGAGTGYEPDPPPGPPADKQ